MEGSHGLGNVPVVDIRQLRFIDIKAQIMHVLPGRVGGVTVSMVAFQAVDPGSTPGRRTLFEIK